MLKNKKYLQVLAICITFFVGIYCISPTITEAAIPVIDLKNIFEAHATFLKAVQEVINTFTMIDNQIKELTSMAMGDLMKQISGITKQFDDFKGIMDKSKGLMQGVDNLEEVWSKAFKDITTFGDRNNLSRITDGQAMVDMTDKTFKDALDVAKVQKQIEEDTKALKDALDQSANAIGNKHVTQAGNQIKGLEAKELITLNEQQAYLNAAITAHYNKENQDRAAALAEGKQIMDSCQKELDKGNTLSGRKRGWL